VLLQGVLQHVSATYVYKEEYNYRKIIRNGGTVLTLL